MLVITLFWLIFNQILICRELDRFPHQVPLNIVGDAEANAKALRLLEEQIQHFESSEFFLQKICSVSIYFVLGESYRGMLNFFKSTSQIAHLLLCLHHRWRGEDFILPLMPLPPGIELMSVQLHVIWGTLIQDDWTTTAVGIMLNLVYIPSDKSCVSLARKQVRSDWYRAAWIKSCPKLNEPLMLS